MNRINYPSLIISLLAILASASEVQAQVYYYPSSSPRFVPQNRTVYRTPNRVYANNGLRYQSYRPSYGQTTVYSNGGYSVQPNHSYTQSAPTYYGQPSTPYYYDYSNSQPVYSGNQGYSSQPSTYYYNGYSNSQPVYSGDQIYSNQPSTAYSSNYGSGFYDSPQQAANANVGARIGNAIGGSQGAQVGAAIGAAIRP